MEGLQGRKLNREEAIGVIDEIVDIAEAGFYSENGEYPSFSKERDFILMGEHLDIPKETDKWAYMDIVKDEGEYRTLAIPGQYIAYFLLLNWVQYLAALLCFPIWQSEISVLKPSEIPYGLARGIAKV